MYHHVKFQICVINIRGFKHRVVACAAMGILYKVKSVAVNHRSTFDSKESKKLSGKIRLLVLGLFMLPIISALYYLFNSWGVSGPSPTVIFVIAMVFEVVLLIINVCFCRKKAKMDYEYRQVLYNNLHIIMKELNKLSENQLIFNLYIKKIESGPKIGLCICLSFFLGAVCGVGCMFATWNEG
eukprot:175527_1